MSRKRTYSTIEVESKAENRKIGGSLEQHVVPTWAEVDGSKSPIPSLAVHHIDNVDTETTFIVSKN
jgi:hypothetical protein